MIGWRLVSLPGAWIWISSDWKCCAEDIEVLFQQIHERWIQIEELAPEPILLGSNNLGLEDRARFFMGKSQCEANLLSLLNLSGSIHLNEKTVETEIDDLCRLVHAHHADWNMKCNARIFTPIRAIFIEFVING